MDWLEVLAQEMQEMKDEDLLDSHHPIRPGFVLVGELTLEMKNFPSR